MTDTVGLGCLSDFLVEKGWVSEPQVSDYRHLDPQSLWEVAVRTFRVPESEVLNEVAAVCNGVYRDASQIILDTDLTELFEDDACQANRFVPVCRMSEGVWVAVDSPIVSEVTRVVSAVVSGEIRFIYMTRSDLDVLLRSDKVDSGDRTLLDFILLDAVDRQISDLHLCSTQEGGEACGRVDGELFRIRTYSRKDWVRLCALVKVHAQMDISNQLTPQDGRMQFQGLSGKVDIRVASLPTLYGEDFVCRFFGPDVLTQQVGELGLSDCSRSQIEQAVSASSGLVLVTGPTGSGKTTTLYAVMRFLREKGGLNIVSLEDPIESVMSGVRQSAINRAAGYDFASGIRAVLRQDPDVIVVGEIRDRETAKVALEAAYTGHLVISTLHTHQVRSALMRLATFDLDPFMVMQSLRGVFSQRLIRKRCGHCSSGCTHCGFSGLSGRQLIMESLRMPSTIDRIGLDDVDRIFELGDFRSFDEDIRVHVSAGAIDEIDEQHYLL